MKVLSHTWFMVVRQARNLMREPIWIALLLIQPMVWLLLYGQLFKNVTKLGGFGTTSATPSGNEPWRLHQATITNGSPASSHGRRRDSISSSRASTNSG